MDNSVRRRLISKKISVPCSGRPFSVRVRNGAEARSPKSQRVEITDLA
jgi:hypothetical protein